MTQYLLELKQFPGELLLFLTFLFILDPINSETHLPAFESLPGVNTSLTWKGNRISNELFTNTSDSHQSHHHRHKHGQLRDRSHATGRLTADHLPPTLPHWRRNRTEIVTLGNVTVLVGQRAELKCGASHLGNNTVVWLRHRDTNLLSAGLEVYTQDVRFLPFWEPGNIWGLRISAISLTDAGLYECQISTTPPVSDFTFLRVVEPITRIDGLGGLRGYELYIDAGSTINLTCIVEDATDYAPKQVLWKHGSKVVNFEWARGGVSLVTEKVRDGVTMSRLLLQKSVRTDSGIYLCAPRNAHTAYVRVIVLEQGETQAAMQSSSISINKLEKCILLNVVTVLVIVYLFC